MCKFLTADEFAKKLTDGCTVGICSFTAVSMAEDLLVATEKRFLTEGHPQNIKVFHASGVGDYKQHGMGLNHLAHKGLIKTVYGAHTFPSPDLAAMINAGEIASYIVPQGVCVHMNRAIAGGQPGVITHIGLETYADPRQDGCRANDACKDEIVELIKLDGREYLFYKAFPIDFCMLKGSFADEDGNISFQEEPLMLEQLEMAAATRASGGKVAVQVHAKVPSGSLDPQKIKIPSVLVDYVIIGRPEYTFQTHLFEGYHPELMGEKRIELNDAAKIPLDLQKLCGRRALFELEPGMIVNIGGGVPETVAPAAEEEGITDKIKLSVESGVFGGVPVPGGIGLSFNPEAVLKHPDMFDLYDGGFLDITFLGFAEIDSKGNVNATKFSGRVTGPGGFVNIVAKTKRIVFLGTFCAGGLDIKIVDSGLDIRKDGQFNKFVSKVEQISFNGQRALRQGQQVTYITERAVFKLTEDGVVLIEIAPGVDLQKDILDKMAFSPVISKNLKYMDERIFKRQRMGFAFGEA